MKESVIYVVSTPIGNLADMSQRSLAILRDADLIAAEDTRNTKKLLGLLGIDAPRILSYFDHNEASRADQIVKQILGTPTIVALVSDAGTPCISDPGYRLISMAKAAGIRVSPIPGASAVIALISASGLPSDRFQFVGFLPTKKNALLAELAAWQERGGSIVFFESPHRIKETIRSLSGIIPNILMCLGRELTKVYEEIVTLPIVDMLSFVDQHSSLKGEMVCMLSFPQRSSAPKNTPDEIRTEIRSDVISGYREGYSHKDLCDTFSECGLARKELFRFLLQVKADLGD